MSRLEYKAAEMKANEESNGHYIKNGLNGSPNKLRQELRSKYLVVPRSGVEYPFTLEKTRFEMKQREFEPCHCYNPCLAEEYAKIDGERITNPSGQLN